MRKCRVWAVALLCSGFIPSLRLCSTSWLRSEDPVMFRHSICISRSAGGWMVVKSDNTHNAMEAPFRLPPSPGAFVFVNLSKTMCACVRSSGCACVRVCVCARPLNPFEARASAECARAKKKYKRRARACLQRRAQACIALLPLRIVKLPYSLSLLMILPPRLGFLIPLLCGLLPYSLLVPYCQ